MSTKKKIMMISQKYKSCSNNVQSNLKNFQIRNLLAIFQK